MIDDRKIIHRSLISSLLLILFLVLFIYILSISLSIASSLAEPNHNISWYLGLRAAFRFETKHNRYPGSDDDKVSSDVDELLADVKKILSEMGLNDDVPANDKYIQEM